jgi:DNA helicase IV
MNRNDLEWKSENEWLQEVLKEVRKQFDEKHDFKERFKKDAIQTQRELWQDIGSVSVTNGLQQVVDFMQFINTMKIQKRSHEFTRKLEEKYERMLLLPYFGRIDFIEKGEEKAERCYIGTSNLINDNYDFLIYDWRSPVSSMFYDYEIGEASYKCPEGIVDGRLTLKRQYKINFSPNDIFNDYISNVLPQLGEDNMCQTTFKEYMHKALGNEFIKENYCEMMEYILVSKKQHSYQKRINNIKFKSSMEFVDILKRYVSYLEKMDRNFIDIIFRGHLIISSKDIQELFFKDYVQLPLKRRLQKIRGRILFLLEPYEKQHMEEVAEELKDSDSFINKVEIMERSAAIVKDEIKGIYYEINKMTEFDLVDIYKNLFKNLELFLGNSNTKYNEKNIDEMKSYTLENLSARILNYEDQPDF